MYFFRFTVYVYIVAVGNTIVRNLLITDMMVKDALSNLLTVPADSASYKCDLLPMLYYLSPSETFKYLSSLETATLAALSWF